MIIRKNFSFSSIVLSAGLSMGLLASLPFFGSAYAADYTIDSAHSTIEFNIGHNVIGHVKGNFNAFDGGVNFDEKTPEKGSVHVSIKADSINTNNTKRDEHLKSPDFFDVQKFPTLTFESKKISHVTDKKYKVTGDLTMHGVTKPVTLDVEFNGTAKDMMGATRAGFNATGKINRKDWGINWNKTLDHGGVAVADELTLSLDIEAVKKDDTKKPDSK